MDQLISHVQGKDHMKLLTSRMANCKMLERMGMGVTPQQPTTSVTPQQPTTSGTSQAGGGGAASSSSTDWQMT
eukprot:12881541-Prorocentrum_lima.AAC.1